MMVQISHAVIIIDNADSASVSMTGTWTSSVWADNYYGTDYLHDGDEDKGTKSVTFTPDIETAGTYEVFMWWTASEGRASNVPVTINYSGGSAQQTINQRTNGAQWISLGSYSFDAGTSGNVVISTTGTDGAVIVDAVKFSSDVIVIDNTDSASVSFTGTWTSSVWADDYYGADYLHDGNEDKGMKSITFTPDIENTEEYEVFMWWTASEGRASNVPVTINYSGGSAQQTINQKVNGAQWISLGTYSFAAGTSGNLVISTTDTDGAVIADAVKFVPGSTVQLVDIIVDSTDSEAIKTGEWTASTMASGYYGANYLHDGISGKGEKSVRYVPEIPTLGLYDVSVRWTASSNRPVNTPYTVNAADGSVSFLADQTQGGGEWQSLGSFVMSEGTSNDVLLSTEGTDGKAVIADAVRFTQSEAYEVIIDNSDPDHCTIDGTWGTSTALDGYYGSNYLHDGATDKGNCSVTFAPDLAYTGIYDVYMNWSSGGSGRSDAVPVDIISSNDGTATYVNQQVNGDMWNYIGTYSFEAGTSGYVQVSNEGTEEGKYVIADAVKFVRTAAEWTPDSLGDRLWLDWRTDYLEEGPVVSWTDNRGGLVAYQDTEAQQPVMQDGEVFMEKNTQQNLIVPHLDGSKWVPHITHRAVAILFRIDLSSTSSTGTLFAINGVGGSWESQPSVRYNGSTNQVSVNWTTPSGWNSFSFPVDPDGSVWHCLVSRREGKNFYASLDGKDVDGNYGESGKEMLDWAMPDSNIFNTGVIGDFRSWNPDIGIDSVLIVQGDVPREDAERLMGWAMWRRGVQGNLPSEHPYRDHKPYAQAETDQFVESTAEEWQAVVDFWKTPALAKTPYLGNTVDLTGWTLDFGDDFDQHSVTDDVKGKGDWFSPTHTAATGSAFTVRPGYNSADPTLGTPAASGYPDTYIQENGTMTIRMQYSDGWKAGAFASVNSNGYGRTWKYPYIEARMKIGPSSTGSYYGAWPALWLRSANTFTNRTEPNMEYDIYEGYIPDVDGHHAGLHNWPAARTLPGRLSSHRVTGNYVALTSSTPQGEVDLFDGEYHTYGCMITPQWVINYFDGIEMHRFPTPIEMKQPLWLLVDLAMMSEGESQSSGIYDLTIDYIRVYQNADYAE
jgi:hypothetical protein